MSRAPRRAGVSERQDRAGWTFAAPAIALIAVFFFLPVVFGFALSFTDFDIYAIGDPSTARWIGLGNYRAVLADPVFWKAVGNTFYFVLVGGPASVVVSLAAALLVHSKANRLPGLFRTVYFMPVVTTLVAVAIVWRYLDHPHYGLVNYALRALHLPAPDWLGDPHYSMPAIVILSVWKNFGYNMLIFLAGLANIPEELYEAAHLDGASWWQRFRVITLPGLSRTLVFVGVITMLGNFQIFAEPYVMTQGGPLKSTTTVVLQMYEEGFRWWHMGLAAAMAFVLFVIMMIGTWVQMRVAPAEES